MNDQQRYCPDHRAASDGGNPQEAVTPIERPARPLRVRLGCDRLCSECERWDCTRSVWESEYVEL